MGVGPLAGWGLGQVLYLHSAFSPYTALLAYQCPLVSSPQHATARHQASAPRSATTPPSHPPRPLKSPSPGPSASSPLTSPSPRPSVRKARAALAVSPCEHSCLLPCVWASVRLPGPAGQPQLGLLPPAPIVTRALEGALVLGRHIPFPVPQRAHFCLGWEPLGVWTVLRKAHSSSQRHVSISICSPARACRSCPPVLLSASVGSGVSALPPGLHQQPRQSAQHLPRGSSLTCW